MNIKEHKVVVIYGGTSKEREVSLRSGKCIYDALKRSGFNRVELFDLKKDNISEIYQKDPDICFLALHGRGGEDGCIQGALELSDIPYTGSGVSASAIAMNKILTKRMLKCAGIPTADFVSISKFNFVDSKSAANYLLEKIGIPMVVKSPCEGSSIGVVIVKEAEKLLSAVDEVFSYGHTLLAETFLNGIEVTLPIIGNYEPRALPIIEITTENEFYDYQSKYTPNMSHHIIPARISEDDRLKINSIGKATYEVLGCKGLSRVDFIIDEKMGPMVIEVNTIPGMTELSLFPDSARAAGITFEELVTELVRLGLEK